MKGILPEHVRMNRKKVGFNAPIFSYLNVKDREVKQSLLDESPIFSLIDKRKIETLLSKESLPNSESKFLFNFLNAKIFLELFS